MSVVYMVFAQALVTRKHMYARRSTETRSVGFLFSQHDVRLSAVQEKINARCTDGNFYN